MRNSTVRAVNRLTRQWAAQNTDAERSTVTEREALAERDEAAEQGTVFTAAGVWPLLALLADGTDGAAREELAQALGIPAGSAAEAARELLAALAGVRGLQCATGLWTREELPLEERWSAQLPPGTRGGLTGDADTDRKALDAWASDRTGGLIEHMPLPVTEDTLLVLASALALRLRWIQPFDECRDTTGQGPWAGRELPVLRRETTLLDRVSVARGPRGPVTVLEVVGSAGVDVHLVLGEPEAAPGAVLATGIDALTRALPSTGASLLPEGEAGPGLTVRSVRAETPEPRLSIRTVAFEVRAEHDLLAHAALFGLRTASDTSGGHFPGISTRPLAVESARQSALARFHATGFEAAAVTAFAAVAGCAMPRLRYRTRRVDVRYDRPFGFLAVHRTSRLVLAAGWVREPDPVPSEDDY
ncbi:serpin family protein [Streptomyces sp. NPDC058746]|uniref:serpin family protein n=1 Tax=Streptomyces sp. NPDC058746 TaxID=3346622 RepID=UPI00368A80A3